MKILLISDTHGFLDESILAHASNADEVWHAGDIGNISVADQLESAAPLRAVYGNIDGADVRSRFPEYYSFEVSGLRVLMIHIGGYPGHYARGVKERITYYRPDLFLCGHSHILRIGRDPAFTGMLCVNPGAAGISGFHQVRTLVRMELKEGVVQTVDVIELGPRTRN